MRVARFTVTIALSVYDTRRVKRYYNRIVPVKKRSFGLMFRLWALYISGVHDVKFQHGENCVSGFVSTRTIYMYRRNEIHESYPNALLYSLSVVFTTCLYISLICASLYAACNMRKVQASTLIRRTYQNFFVKTLSFTRNRNFIRAIEWWNLDRNEFRDDICLAKLN